MRWRLQHNLCRQAEVRTHMALDDHYLRWRHVWHLWAHAHVAEHQIPRGFQLIPRQCVLDAIARAIRCQLAAIWAPSCLFTPRFSHTRAVDSAIQTQLRPSHTFALPGERIPVSDGIGRVRCVCLATSPRATTTVSFLSPRQGGLRVVCFGAIPKTTGGAAVIAMVCRAFESASASWCVARLIIAPTCNGHGAHLKDVVSDCRFRIAFSKRLECRENELQLAVEVSSVLVCQTSVLMFKKVVNLHCFVLRT